MAYPYDHQLDSDTLAFLKGFRGGDPEAEPDESMTALITDDMPVDLKAWLHTYSLHGGLIAIGDLWLEAGNCQPLAHVVDAFDAADNDELVRTGVDGLDLDAAVIMGNTADGEVFYAAAWKPGDSKLTMVKFCVSGYADDGYVALGSLMEAMRNFAADVEDPDDIDEEVRAILTS